MGVPSTLPNMSIVLFLDTVTNAGRDFNSSFLVVNIIPDPATLIPPSPPSLDEPIIYPIDPGLAVYSQPPWINITASNTSDIVRYEIYNSHTNAGVEHTICPNVTASSTLYDSVFPIPWGYTMVCARAFALDGRVSPVVSHCG